MGAVEMLARASGEFDRRLRDIAVPLDATTPCEGWTVRDLLQHVIVGNRIAVVMLEGRSRDEIVLARQELLEEDQIGDDPAAAFASSGAAQVAAFSAPGALGGTIHHHVFDTMPARQLATFHTDLDDETATVFRDGSPLPLPHLGAPRPTGDGR